ncbi:MAG TPA: SRPBCC domain-containing protein [Mucilaginibacter sp.]|nr:SRPBCC domain-containing protein [Mucilaginibacter sp.]
MNNPDFTTAFLVDQTPLEAYDAINNVRAWWSGQIEGDTDKLGDEFIYRYKTFHYSKHKLTELVPGKKVVWLTTESRLNFVGNQNEWTGTKIVFDIAEKDGKTQVRFTHQGLVPQFQCFNDCSNAWSGYINNSLRELIVTGVPQARPVE